MNTYPSLLDRIKSSTIDVIIVIAAMFLISEILGHFKNVPDAVRAILFITIWLYEPLCTAFGATIGNDKMQIRVRKHSDPTKKINLFQSLTRFFFKLMFGWLSFITLFTNSEKRAIHDFICGSVMIEYKPLNDKG